METPLPPQEALQEHAAFVQALAGRLVADPQTADDLAQETWLALLQHPPSHPEKIRGWLATTLRRFAGRLDRTNSRRAYREREAAHPESQPSAADQIQHEDLIETIAGSVLDLSEPYRRMVIRRYYLGLTAAEIARQEGVPSGTVRSRLKRALDELRGRLDRRFGDRQTWSMAMLAMAREWKPIVVGAPTGAALTGGLFTTTTSLKLLWAGALAAGLWFLPRVWSGPDPLEPLAARGAAEISVTTASALLPEVAPEAAVLTVDALDEDRTQVAATGSAAAVLRILEWDGSPNGDLLCLLMDRTGGTRSVRTDESGVAVFDDGGGDFTLVVERRGAPPHRAAIRLQVGDQELQLPRGEELAGRILVEGLAPEQPLRLVAYQASSRNESVTWNDENAELVLRSSVAPATTWTQPDGSFRFVGLASDWRGNLRLPRGYAEAGTLGASSPYERIEIFLPELTREVFLDLDRFPSLRGRVVAPEGRPALGGVVETQITWKSGMGMYDGATCDEDGRFEIFLEDEVRAVTLRYWENPGRSGEIEVALGEGDLPEDGNLGDLSLGRARTVELLVLDVDGEPIAGAVCPLASKPTDDSGSTVIEGVGEKTEEVRVAARGFHGARTALEAQDQSVVVVLDRATIVSLALVDPSGEPVAHKRVEIASAEALFAYGDDQALSQPNYLDRDLYRGQWIRGASRAGDVRVIAEVDQDGRLALGDIRPDIPFVLRAYSAGGRILCESRQEPLEPQEQRELTLVLGQELHVYVGTVLDEHGRPLPEAAVHLVTEGSANGGTSRRTDAQGQFEIPWVAAQSGRLTFTREGYLPLVVEDKRLSSEGDEEDSSVFTLTPGRTVRVRVLDELGLDVPQGRVSARGAEKWHEARPIAAATFELVGLEDEPTEVQLRLAGATYTEVHDPREPELVFVVPAHGSVEVVWAGPEGPEWSEWLTVVLAPRGAQLAQLDHVVHGVPQGDHEFELVLPGEYDVYLTHDGEEDEEELTRRIPIVVEAGQATRVELP